MTLSEKSNIKTSVESIVFNEGKILLVKRAPHCRVAPGVWNVPAGKVKLSEEPENAVIRETYEETGLLVSIGKLLSDQTFEILDGNEKVRRHMFTYLTLVNNKTSTPKIILNDEHTEYAWLNLEEIHSKTYSSLMPRLLGIIINIKDLTSK